MKNLSALERSMEYERAFAEMTKVRTKIGAMRNAAEDEARKNGDPRPSYYDIIMDDMMYLQTRYQREADKAFQMHKETHTPNVTGIENLANAVVMSAIQDYEEAVSSGRRGAGGVIRSIRKFAATEAGFYTTADVSGILSRIDATYPKFKRVALNNVDAIKAETKRLKAERASKEPFSQTGLNRYNPFRCPLCGGGLWYSGGKEKRIRCSSCYLSVSTEKAEEII